MPHEITSKEQFKELLGTATEVRVVQKEESAKLKLKTPKGLFTFKTSADEVEALTKGLKVPVTEY